MPNWHILINNVVIIPCEFVIMATDFSLPKRKKGKNLEDIFNTNLFLHYLNNIQSPQCILLDVSILPIIFRRQKEYFVHVKF